MRRCRRLRTRAASHRCRRRYWRRRIAALILAASQVTTPGQGPDCVDQWYDPATGTQYYNYCTQ